MLQNVVKVQIFGKNNKSHENIRLSYRTTRKSEYNFMIDMGL